MKRYVLPIVCLLVAAGVQGNLPACISIMGAMPDLVLVVLICFSLAEDPEFGAGLGFLAGLIQGSVVGMGMGSLIFTRTITGFVAGLVSTRLFSANAIVPAFSVLAYSNVRSAFSTREPQAGRRAGYRDRGRAMHPQRDLHVPHL